MTDQSKIILLVGHCGPDAWALASAVKSALAGAEVRMVTDDESLLASIDAADLLLVNRVLDGDFASDAGIDLIREFASRPTAPPVMLISNFPEAQADALAAGAKPGFGKRQIYDPATRDRILEAVGA
jgi:hypothetical protein